MQKKKFLIILALLLMAVAQGAWAADRNYKYPTKTKPQFYAEYGGKSNVVVINTPAELAYITAHFSEGSDYNDNKDWYELNYYLNADIDMGTEYSWLPLGRESFWVKDYEGTFWGNGHTIKFMTWDLDEENQGLFSTIHLWGKVYDVNVICSIDTDKKIVGGIAGENWGLIQNCTATVDIRCHDHNIVGGIIGYLHSSATVKDCHVMGRIECTGASGGVGGIAGRTSDDGESTIRNCWVEADIITENAPSLHNADVGGIAGESFSEIQYCCMTGNVTNTGGGNDVAGITGANNKTVSHCTFYGTVSVNHDQKNKYIGGDAPVATDDHLFDTFNQGEYDAAVAAGMDLYARAIKYPYAVNIKEYGPGELQSNEPRGYPGQTISLTVASGTLEEITVRDAAGNDIVFSGNATDGYTFTMPRKNVNITAWFDGYGWPIDNEGDGTAENPYTIRGNEEWDQFAGRVNSGKESFDGKYIRLEADLRVSQLIGYDEGKPFSGTFLGNGHTLTYNVYLYKEYDEIPWQGISPFHYIKNATIKDLRVAGSITSDAAYTAGLVGFAEGTNLIENCVVTATLNISSDNAGGIVGNGQNSSTTIRGCVFAGTINGLYEARSNVGGIWGYCNGATPTLQNCLEVGTYTNISSMHPIGLQGASGTITNCYYVTPQIGSPDNACTVSGAKRAYTITAGDDVTLCGLGTATGIMYDGTCYASSGETVALTLSHGSRSGYTFSGYTASAGTLSGNTLTMPAADVIINATWTKNEYALADDADNSTFIIAHDGDVYDITLQGRTLYKDGAWNTLCLPFDLVLEGSALEGATARPLSSASISGTTLSLTFGEATTTLTAGTPYIIKWTADANYVDDDEHNIVAPVFSGVTIYATDRSYDNEESGDERVRFLGTYAKKSFTGDDKSILMMGGENTLYYPLANASIGACRAYFKIGEDGEQNVKPLTAFNINFGDDETTGIAPLLSPQGGTNLSPLGETEGASWYDLSGRHLNGQPSRAGVYINKGVKVIIK